MPGAAVEFSHREHVRRSHRVHCGRAAGGDGGTVIMLDCRCEGFFRR